MGLLGLAACSPEPGSSKATGEQPVQQAAPKPREPEDWERYGMAGSDAYRELLHALNEEAADKLYLVLIPLLNSQPELMLQEHFARVMIYAAEFGCRKTMQHLPAIRAPADVMDADGLTPLDFALYYGYEDIAAMLRAHGAKRHTPRPTARELWEAEERAAEELRQQVAAEYQAKLKSLKPGDPLPIMDVVPGPIHRPSLRSQAAKERQGKL